MAAIECCRLEKISLRRRGRLLSVSTLVIIVVVVVVESSVDICSQRDSRRSLNSRVYLSESEQKRSESKRNDFASRGSRI